MLKNYNQNKWWLKKINIYYILIIIKLNNNVIHNCNILSDFNKDKFILPIKILITSLDTLVH